MSNVPGAIPSAAAGMPYHSAKRTRLEYSTVVKTGLIDPSLKASEPQKNILGSSAKKIGCGWSQFPGYINSAIEYMSLFIGTKSKDSEEHIIKSMQINSEEKAEQYDEFNIDKKPVENSLELCDQQISSNCVMYSRNTSVGKFKFLSLKEYICVESKKNLAKISSGLQIAVKNKSGEKKIILTGDFNMDPKKTMNWINRMGVGLIRTPIYNSKGSRLKGSKMGRMIYHICSTSPVFKYISVSAIKKCQYIRSFFGNGSLDVSNILKTVETIIKIDREKIQINSDKIINNNYYSLLNNSIKNNSEELGTNECIEKLLGVPT
ncbi:hypothetical protein BB561_006888 [Smittium simulii]|uniref:Uncharacterized protein n=1 Tax=Smittium simulii TaxID=133385 RepID=A0A2T9Y0P6_9FUNG|nr:hypothetical protein BB561_006888 [Smittium simulii]